MSENIRPQGQLLNLSAPSVLSVKSFGSDKNVLYDFNFHFGKSITLSWIGDSFYENIKHIIK